MYIYFAAIPKRVHQNLYIPVNATIKSLVGITDLSINVIIISYPLSLIYIYTYIHTLTTRDEYIESEDLGSFCPLPQDEKFVYFKYNKISHFNNKYISGILMLNV